VCDASSTFERKAYIEKVMDDLDLVVYCKGFLGEIREEAADALSAQIKTQ
jgi:hypothetical protein